MYKAEKESVSNSRCHCKVGKITPKKTGIGDSSAIQIDFKTEDFKKSNNAFIEKIRNL